MMYPKPKRIKSTPAIDSCRKERCEICGGLTYGAMPHHVYSRGAGGPDHCLNLIQLDGQCHVKAHSGKISRGQQLEIIARREGMTVVEVEVELYRMRRGDYD